jgi:hypothetical protein
MRFRHYDEKKEAKQAVFNQFESTLYKLKMNFQTVLLIETKSNQE